ncbi:hypothetical protein [Bacillus sp. 03113]|uniref:hypothetical protein n=1 Tax=Bacillus sp. 03113 TaxID=2578211 RepID=UPI0011426FDE|nr:hypothetical protein [Bacillus sp. 03113]
MNKSPILAFLFSLFPGGGMLYLRKPLRGLFYMISFWGLVFFTILFANDYYLDQFAFLFVFLGFILFIVNIVDTIISANKLSKKPIAEQPVTEKAEDNDRFNTLLLSLLPGVGHVYLGLMNRGVTLLTTFLGLGIMVFFVAILTHRGEFLVFWAILPVIWIYGYFDAMQQLGKKQRGEELIDRTILDDFESRREDGKKSKAIATFLSIFPGAGHLYLGLQQRGIQLMGAFLFSIYILDVLRLGIFLFLIPIIWFYSFFDGLQTASKMGEEPIEDKPIIASLFNHQKWIGIGLIFIGLYYLTTNIIIPAFSPMLRQLIDIDLRYLFDRYFQMSIVSIVLIGGGIRLLFGSKRKGKQEL